MVQRAGSITEYYGSGYASDSSYRSRNSFRQDSSIASTSKIKGKARLVDIPPTAFRVKFSDSKPKVLSRISGIKHFAKQWFSSKTSEDASIRNDDFLDDVSAINRYTNEAKVKHKREFENHPYLNGDELVLQMVCLESITDELLRMKKVHSSVEDRSERSSLSKRFKSLGMDLVNLTKCY